MASSRTPGPECSLRNPKNVNDGTLCRQASSEPGILGSLWDGFQTTATWTFRIEATGASYLFDSGVAFVETETALLGRFAHSTLDEAKKLLNELVEKIKNAADWEALNRLAGPILGPTSLQLGVLYGIGESLTGDVVGLLGLAKMIVLAGLYERIKHAGVASFIDPTMTALAFAAQAIPGLAAEMKKADDQLWKMLNELLGIVKDPITFFKNLGQSIKKEAIDDWNKLKDYAEHPTVTNQFQAGRIFGKVLYQVIMLILLVLSVAGAVAKLAARVPWLLRFARIIKAGGELEELETAEKVQQAARAVEDVEGAEKVPKKPLEEEGPRGPKKPVASALEGSEFNGVKADRVRPGTNDKVAVVGRGMDGAVNPYAEGLSGEGYNVETFQPSSSAQEEWAALSKSHGGRIPDDVIPETQMFKENQFWAQKLADQGYTVVDVDNPAGQGTSPFYEMEKQTLFGDSSGGGH